MVPPNVIKHLALQRAKTISLSKLNDAAYAAVPRNVPDIFYSTSTLEQEQATESTAAVGGARLHDPVGGSSLQAGCKVS